MPPQTSDALEFEPNIIEDMPPTGEMGPVTPLNEQLDRLCISTRVQAPPKTYISNIAYCHE